MATAWLRRGFGTLGATLLALVATGGMAAAQGAFDWRGQLTPYVWATGLGGDLRPFATGPTVEIDRSFSDILGDLDAAFFLSGFARRDRFVLLGDLSYSSASRAGVLSAPIPGLPAEGRLRQTSLTLAGGWRVSDTLDGTLDLLGGLRHWRVRGEVGAPAVPGVFPGARVSASRNFTDPIIAARANLRLTPDWSVLLYGDVGGFGVGSRSTAQLLGTVNYSLGNQVTLSAGYRHLSVDYRSGGSRFDVRLGGPIFGATIEF